MKRKILTLSLCLVVIIATLLSFSSCRKIFSETDKAVGNYVYKADSSGGIAITKYLGKFTRIEIPEKIDGYTVRSISPGVFSEVPGIKSVTVPNTISKIEAGIFTDCLALQSVTFNADSVDIADEAFKGCSSLTKVSAKGKIAAIGNEAFLDCINLEEVKADEGINYIGNDAFKNCKSLTSVDLSENFSYVAASAFEGCERLSYGEYGNCIYLGNGKIPYAYLLGPTSNSVSYVYIHKDTKVVAEGAFENCYNLSEIYINSDAGIDAFLGFGKNTASQSQTISITLGENLSKIPYEFLNSIAMKIGSLTFKDGINVAEIGKVRFYDFKRLESIVLPKGVNYIGANTFNSCTHLKSVTLPDDTTSIGYGAFQNCTRLSSINIPNGVYFIGPYAFENCTSLNTIYIPKSVATIDTHAFKGCMNLRILTDLTSQPNSWSAQWNSSGCPVSWSKDN